MIFSSSVTFIDNNQPNIGDIPCASITWRWKIYSTSRTLLFVCPEPKKPKVWGVRLNENSGRWSSLQVLQHLDRGNQRTLDQTWLWGKEAHMQLWTCWYWCSNPVQQVSSFSGLTNVTFLHIVRFVYLHWVLYCLFCLYSHDCGFHMLMHAEHWDGHSMQYFKESDIPNIRKLLLHKWLTHKDNVCRIGKTGCIYKR